MAVRFKKTRILPIFAIMGKHLGLLFLLSLFVAMVSCENKTKTSGHLMDYVPEDASMVIKISDWETFRSDLQNNSLFSKLAKTPHSEFFKGQEVILKNLQPKSESLLCIQELRDSITTYTFISKYTDSLFPIDSLKNKSLETLNIDGKSMQRLTIDDKLVFSTIVDSMFIASSSQEVLMAILNKKTEQGETFKKVFQLPTSNNYTALVRGNKIKITDSTEINFTTWSALDISISPESITANGISIATDTIPQLLSVFEGQIPQQTHAAALIPMNAKGALSFTFDDSEKLQEKLNVFQGSGEKPTPTGIFDSSSEVGSIQLHNGTAVFIKSIDATTTTDALARFVSSESAYRDVEIKSFSEPKLFKQQFQPLIQTEQANFVFQVDDFFVFTPDEAMAQELIGAYLNNSTLENASYYGDAISHLSSASSLLMYRMQGAFSDAFPSMFNFSNHPSYSNIKLDNFPLVALQFSYDRNFAHVTLSGREFGGQARSIANGVTEKFHVNLDQPILGDPQVFETNVSNVVVQDVKNTLHLISESGKLLWTKSLDAPILGDITQVDLYKNGNQQMAFATKNAVYILDRNGKDVGAFPLKLKDEVTQPLSVFDYDNNHNYRFVVSQGSGILMYDKNAKIVSGFGFKKASSDIVLPPAHIRMGNKDYILIAEKSGKLNILSRVGKSRVNVSKTFNFSEIPLTTEENTFVVITKDNTKERISDKGQVSSLKLDVGSNYWFTIEGNVKATLDDNLLRINGKLVDLPIGYYSEPVQYRVSRTTYTAITELQEKKVYLFDEAGRKVDGFPVYGSSKPSIGTRGIQKSSTMAVKSDSNGIVVYQLN